MFGESESESPRVPSPWDSLASSPSPPTHNRTQAVPKLDPEVEEGNVEYKLQLLSPTPARFDRLVTQLKWRLLEGGGSAYYELGVADSGILVGLPRQQLEESLETLVMMAAELGACVIVVKEIEVPSELSSLAESQLERWSDGKRSSRRKDLLRMTKFEREATLSACPTESETELPSVDITDTEKTSSSPVTLPAPPGDPAQFRRSPDAFPFDPALAMFTIDVREDVAEYVNNEASIGKVSSNFVTEFPVSLVISSVYKPCPTKKRPIPFAFPPSTHFEYVKKCRNGYPPSKSTDTSCHTGDSPSLDALDISSQQQEAKLQFRRDKQARWRELKYDARVPMCGPAESPTNTVGHHTVPSCSTDEPNLSVPESHTPTVITPDNDALETITNTSKVPRLIVEALVVRELSLDEAFLDFEGFSLQ